MNTSIWHRTPIWRAVCTTALAIGLSACGGGNDSKSPDTTTQPGKVSLTGVVSKGVMVGADVKAYAVKADGSVDRSTALASVLSTAGGAYTLPAFELASGTPVVVEVSVNASTTHVDELQGNTTLPTGMTLRAAVVPNVVGNQITPRRVSLTPFTEMAVKAAEKSSAKLSTTNIAQANSTMQQLLGFDPVGTEIKPLATNLSVEEQAYQVVLTATSQLARDEALGCSDTQAGARIQCVVERLTESTRLDTVELTDVGNVDVTAAFRAAVTTTVGSTPFKEAEVTLTTVDTLLNKLDCALTDTCAAVAPSTVAPIAAAKAMFAGLRTDMSGLFTRGGVAGTGELNLQAQKFQAAARAVQQPVNLASRDLQALQLGIRLYQDYHAGTTTSNSRNAGVGDVIGIETLEAPGRPSTWHGTTSYPAVGCTLYEDDKTSIPATSKATARFVGCRATYWVHVTRTFNQPAGPAGTMKAEEARHGFTLTPPAADGEPFTYAASASRRTRVWTGCTDVFLTATSCQSLEDVKALRVNFPTNADNTATGFQGSVQVATVNALTLAGELPGAFTEDGTSLLNHHHRWDIQAVASSVQPVLDIVGQVDVFNDASQVVAGTLLLEPGTRLNGLAVSATGSKPTTGQDAKVGLGSGNLNVSWATPTARLSGNLTGSTPVWDRSGTRHVVQNTLFSGVLSSRSDASASWTEVITGKFEANASGYADHDASQPLTAANTYQQTMAFGGLVQASARPTLRLVLTGSKPAHLREPTVITGSVRTEQAGVARQVLQISAARGSDQRLRVTLSEATSGLSMRVVTGEGQSQLLHDQSLIGTLDHANGRMTYVNGDFESLDIGL
ncbi:hypothetical protein [Leptothrix discophora]|uniref:Carboxypeptidase regulatory-like domain-containing protein n=1 Tax=Leptothrix discophora TaxID=89 RepID=A0ABT9G3B7_LEPDI|nr:hypothetical protein [Leptothrix discophora]MDP4300989.1 hypothetical protein [Leptothrix discophora]